MTNIPNKHDIHHMHGAATLITTVILLTVATLIIVFSGNYARMQSTSASNMTRNEEAFAAAEAGLEYGINYIKENYTTIIANPVNGYIPIYTNAAITSVVMANNATFTVVYTNPTANDYKLIEITSTGTSSDGTATKTVSQQVVSGSILMSTPDNPLSVSGTIDMSGSSQVYNIESNATLEAGEEVSFQGSSSTITSGGGSDKSHMSDDVQQDSGNMLQTDGQILNDYFGTDSLVFVKSKFTHQYTNSGSTNFNSVLDGKTGTSIWIDQTDTSTVVLNGNTVLGTTASPVIVVVNNGTLELAGNVSFSGFIFTLGASSLIDIRGNATTSGGMVGTGDMTVSGSATITYSSAVLSSVQQLSSMTYFAKVPGTWRDY